MVSAAAQDAAARAGTQADVPGAALDGASIDRAHRMLLDDRTIQFDLPERAARPRNPPPEWLLDIFRAIGRGIEWVGGGWTVIAWIAAAVALAALLYAFVPGVRQWVQGLVARGRRADDDAPPDWTPDAATARALLDEADALAAAGRFAEAVHLLLFRSIEDIQAWRGDLVRPSLTARDIARAEALPASARPVFGRIVAAVERAVFAGRPLGQDDWHHARADYFRFALGPA